MTRAFYRPDLLALVGALATIAGPTASGAPPTPPTASGNPADSATSAAAAPRGAAVACTLSSAEKRERAAAIRRDLLPRVRSVDELPNGYVLWFDRVDGELARVASFVELESQCCAFLDFAIRLGAGGDRIALHLEGAPGTKE